MALPTLPYVRSGMTSGLSARAALAEFRAAGGAVRSQDWFRLWSETSRLRTGVQEAMDRPKAAIPSGTQIVNRATVRARGYGQWVSIFQRTSGESDLIMMPYLVKTNEPISPQQAEDQALAFLAQSPDEYGRVTLGVTYTGTERFVPQQ